MPETQHHNHKVLYRSSENKVIAGVCGGIAEYFHTDPALVRIIFVFLAFIGAGGLLLYIVLWAMLPEKNEHHHSHNDLAHEVRNHMDTSHARASSIVGLFIILIGVLFLVDQFFPGYGFEKFWPIFLIVFGVLVMFRRHHNH